MSEYVYIESERFPDETGFIHVLYTVGYYTPSGKWEPDSDHTSRDAAAARVHFLNGGDSPEMRRLYEACQKLFERIDADDEGRQLLADNKAIREVKKAFDAVTKT